VAAGGATLRDLDHETQAFGLAAPVGVVSATGLGGLTLHGGYGWLSRRLGLSIDNLLAVDIVTADGQLRHASAEEEPELYWAVRGGGGEFGVVTAFEFRLSPVGPEVWFGLTMYPMEQGADALRRFRDHMSQAPEELGALGVLWTAPEAPPIPEPVRGRPVFVFAACYSGPPERGEEVLRPFREFGEPLLDATQRIPFAEAQQALDENYPDGRLYYWKSSYLTELSDGAIDVLVAHASERPSPLSSVIVWALGGAVARVPPTETPFGMRAAPYMVGIEANWEDAAHTDENMAWNRSLFADLKPFSAGASYLNFPGFYEEGEAMLKGAYGENLERLKRVKAQYDPEGMFGTAFQ
jgi:FAD/FMN-containing dehydrogenase